MENSFLIDAALGNIESDTQFYNCKIVDVFAKRVIDGSFTVYNGIIVGINESLPVKSRINCNNMYCVPGFIDAHVHIESSLLVPYHYANVVLPHGTTAVVADPHEIANVMGYEGIKYMMHSARQSGISVYFMVPSSVPATDFDSSGAVLKAEDMGLFVNDDMIKGLGEVMNYPGVLNKNTDILEKINLFKNAGKVIDGHAPFLSGKQLNAYILAGIQSDHECTTKEEAMEKLSKGMRIMMREGSSTKDLQDLLPIINNKTLRNIMLCSDDRHPDDLMREGHIDYSVRYMIKQGIDPVSAIVAASYNPADYFRLKGHGALAPGYFADFFLTPDLENLAVSKVFTKGVLRADNGKVVDKPDHDALTIRDSVNIKLLNPEDFKIPCMAENKKIRIIKAKEDTIITGEIHDYPKVADGLCVSDTARDYCKLFVIERHNGTGNIGKGFIHGFGLYKGAIGTTISHDSHNMIIIGVDDISIFRAAKHLNKVKGGIVYAVGDDIMAELPLPVAGLMSDRDVDFVLAMLQKFDSQFTAMKLPLKSPLMTLSFMALPVIPKLKLTDQGLIDVEQFKKVDLFV